VNLHTLQGKVWAGLTGLSRAYGTIDLTLTIAYKWITPKGAALREIG